MYFLQNCVHMARVHKSNCPRLSVDSFWFWSIFHNCKTNLKRKTWNWGWPGYARLARTLLNLTCQLCRWYVDYFQYLWTHISFIAILFGKLRKSLISFANIYSSSITPIAVTGSFENCSVGKEQSIPAIKLLPVRLRESASLQSAESSLSQFV